MDKGLTALNNDGGCTCMTCEHFDDVRGLGLNLGLRAAAEADDRPDGAHLRHGRLQCLLVCPDEVQRDQAPAIEADHDLGCCRCRTSLRIVNKPCS